MGDRARWAVVARPRRGLLVFVGLLGAFLCGLALPAVGGRLADLAGKAALDRLSEGGELTVEGYRRLLGASDRARSWLAEPRLQKDLAVALHGIALRESDTDAAGLLVEAREAMLAGLEEAPADPIGWLRLAQLEAALLDLGRAAQALRTSHRVGPVSPEIGVARSALALGLWPWLAQAERERAGVELVRSFLRDPATLAGVARATGTVDVVRELLGADANALAALERELAALAKAGTRDGRAG